MNSNNSTCINVDVVNATIVFATTIAIYHPPYVTTIFSITTTILFLFIY